MSAATPHPTIRPQPGILAIDLYVPGEGAGPSNRALKLSANENPFGPSPAAKAAFLAAADDLHLYPESHAPLRRAIAEVHGLDPARVICGAGSDEIIEFLCQAYAGPGDEVLFPEHAFSMYRISAQVAGATPVTAPETDRTADVDALLAAATDRTALVFLANPNNPTGTLVGPQDLARLAAGLPARTLLVLDGAYAEYVRAPGYDAGLALIEARDNVVMTRTFSKIFGLGGLRIGWGYGPAHVIDVLNRVRGPFNLSAPGLAAAEAAVRDTGWTARCADENEAWRDWLAARLAALGLPVTPSHANFLLVDLGEDRVEAADAFFRGRGLVFRRVGGYGFPGSLRITVGDPDGCRRTAEAAAAFLEGA